MTRADLVGSIPSRGIDISFTASVICIRRTMMRAILRSPSPAPAVRHTTSNSHRIWMSRDESAGQRAIGIVTILPCSSCLTTLEKAACHRPLRDCDWTRTVESEGVEPNTKHRVRVRSVAEDSISDGVIIDLKRRLPSVSSCREDQKHFRSQRAKPVFRFTPSLGKADPYRFCFGSCRHAGPIYPQRSDRQECPQTA